MFVAWTGEHREFATLDEAEKAAFADCQKTVTGEQAERLDGRTPSNLSIAIFETGGHVHGEQHAGNVTLSRDGYPAAFRSWSPASFGTGGDIIELSPEEYAMILGHRRNWSTI